MSADNYNYIYIRRHGEKYAVTMEFDSSDVGPVDETARIFDSFDEAHAAAWKECGTEYGVRYEPCILKGD